ncbi:MAG: hypothetical protein ACRC62_34820 [Microcoleus sp.]
MGEWERGRITNYQFPIPNSHCQLSTVNSQLTSNFMLKWKFYDLSSIELLTSLIPH